MGHKWRFDKATASWLKTRQQNQAPPQVLFLERCIALLKEGGRFGIVVPESLISNKSYGYVVSFLKRHARILAIVGMPESLFKTSGKGGTHTKTCLIVAQRTDAPRSDGKVYMAEAKWCGHDSRGRAIPHDDMPKIVAAYAKFRDCRATRGLAFGFCVSYKDIGDGALCPRYFDPEIKQSLASLQDSHALVTFQELLDDGTLSLATGVEVGKLAYGTGDVPFVRTSDISSWEIKTDPKHQVSEDIYTNLARKQDIKPLDILMVRDGTYLIGACAIITEYDIKMLYQSHIYKIRVEPNPHGLDAYLLLAILSSPVVQRQIRAKQFTQDIIDSLGGRIVELVLPIPRSPAKRDRISRIVRESIDVRVRARELARQARLSVGQP